MKPGDKVEDRWFFDWGLGVVKQVLKTRVKVYFSCAGLVTFDMAHAKKFLRVVTR